MKNKILITGSDGFLASNFIKKFEKKYIFFKYDKKSGKDLTKIKKFPHANIVLHLAAFNSTKDFYSNPNEVIKSNFLTTFNLINYYKNLNKKVLFVFAGTPESASGAVDIYKYKIPTDEKVPFVIPNLYNPRWSYAASKSLCELMLIHSGLKYIIIRPHNVYGPGQKNHFVPEFISRCKKNKRVKLYGWKNKRSWLYVDDFCNALDKILCTKKTIGEIINIGSNFEHTVLEVAKEIIKKKFNNNKIIIKMKAPEGSTMRRVPNINKIKKLTGWKPKSNLKIGISKLLNEI
jgi:nucleoside-diphosphate-sugar epimerase